MVEVPDDIEKKDLLLPHARVVDLVRENTKEGQYVRKSVYFGLNLLLENIAREIAENMVKTENAYIEKSDLDRAAKKYENIEYILKEKERIIKHLRAMEEDIDKLARDIDKASLK